jgi:hypothetical protein
MKTKLISKICFIFLPLMLLSCEKDEPGQIAGEGFLSFSTNGQTLTTVIDNSKRYVKFEIDHDVDVTRLVPKFDVPDGYNAYVNGIPQISGSSAVDFSKPVTYVLKDSKNQSATWQASAIQLSIKILIDASHDGGVWWFPQSPATGFAPDKWHQGQPFAKHLRDKGFVVDELGRGAELTDEMFFGYYIIIRVNGFEKYTFNEIQVYTRLIERGMNLVFFTDHKKYDPVDELAYLLGLEFNGIANGVISSLTPHIITENIDSLYYIAGSVLTNAEQNPDIQILGRLRTTDYADLNFNGKKDDNEPSAPPVMGILNLPKSHIFFIGDTNGLLVMPQPFIDNLIKWMGICF